MNIRLSIGANLGRRAATLREAIRRLAGLSGTRLLAASSFYETAPWGKTDQPPFLNGAVELETTLAPEALLHETQAIEQTLGRVRHEHWGARTIDIDLVYAGNIHRNTPELRLPHPYLLERAFVLEPLREIEPGLILEGRPIADWCEKNAGQGVKKSDELADPWPLQSIACISADRGLEKTAGCCSTFQKIWRSSSSRQRRKAASSSWAGRHGRASAKSRSPGAPTL